MAQIYTDFSEYSSSSQPSDWTERWDNVNTSWTTTDVVGATGGKVMRAYATTQARNAIAWDDADASTNVDIILRFKTTAFAGSAGSGISVIARASGTDTTENGYFWGIGLNGADRSAFISRYNSGTAFVGTLSGYTALNSTIDATDTDVKIRCCVVGTGADVFLKMKVWRSADAEPASWTIEYTDSAADRITGSGWVGLVNAVTNVNRDIDTFFVDTNVATQEIPLATTTITTYAPVGAIPYAVDDYIALTATTYAPAPAISYTMPSISTTLATHDADFFKTYLLTGQRSTTPNATSSGAVAMEINTITGATLPNLPSVQSSLSTLNPSSPCNLYAPVPQILASGNYEIFLTGAV